MGKRRLLKPMGVNGAEREFSVCAMEAGYEVSQSPSIRCSHPVIDRYGFRRKVVTQPDFLVVYSEGGQSMHVEVATGSGDFERKAAQRRVAMAAGVENYVQVTGNELAMLREARTPGGKRTVLRSIFDWKK